MSEERGSVVVTFALPDESRAFVRSLADVRTSGGGRPPALPEMVGTWAGRTVAIVHTGVGDTSAGRTRLGTKIAEPGGIRAVISAGYAGGLAVHLRVGDLVLGENFSDPALAASARQALGGESLHAGRIVSRDAVAATATAKRTLGAETGALAVDMETAWIAEACAAQRLPMLSLRVISDAADQDFPVPGHILFDAARQRPRYLALPAWLLAHPGKIGPFAAFVRGLGPARERLARALRQVIERL